jgi:hypothetical protein
MSSKEVPCVSLLCVQCNAHFSYLCVSTGISRTVQFVIVCWFYLLMFSRWWPRRIVCQLLVWRPGFDPVPVHEGVLVDQVGLGQVFL